MPRLKNEKRQKKKMRAGPVVGHGLGKELLIMKMDQLCRAHPSWCQGRRGLGRRFFGGRRKDDGSGTIKISKLSTQPLNSLFSTLGRIFGALLLL